MLAGFTIHPIGELHLSKDIAKMIEILEREGIDYRLGPLGTAVEGSWDQNFSAIQRCNEMAAAEHGRVIRPSRSMTARTSRTIWTRCLPAWIAIWAMRRATSRSVRLAAGDCRRCPFQETRPTQNFL